MNIQTGKLIFRRAHPFQALLQHGDRVLIYSQNGFLFDQHHVQSWRRIKTIDLVLNFTSGAKR